MIKMRCEGDINTFWDLDTEEGVASIYSIDGEYPKDNNDDPVDSEVADFLLGLTEYIDSSNEEFATIGEFTNDGVLIRQYLDEVPEV